MAPPACRCDSFSFCSLILDAAGTTELRFVARRWLPSGGPTANCLQLPVADLRDEEGLSPRDDRSQ